MCVQVYVAVSISANYRNDTLSRNACKRPELGYGYVWMPEMKKKFMGGLSSVLLAVELGPSRHYYNCLIFVCSFSLSLFIFPFPFFFFIPIFIFSFVYFYSHSFYIFISLFNNAFLFHRYHSLDKASQSQ